MVETTLYQTLRDYLLNQEPRDVYHAYPSYIAAKINRQPRDTLETLVEATFNGDTILNWEMECPYCGGVGNIPKFFETAHPDQLCKACGGEFKLHVDHEAQVTFSPHPNLRDLIDVDNKEYRKELSQQYPPTTVHEVMTIQKFRDWAQNETLPSGEYLEVQRATIWFSDLTGSTALYARNGDPFAYNLVRTHFDIVSAAINQNRGAVVKTIGDGIMAVFSTAARALLAAVEANRNLESYNVAQNLDDDHALRLKIGIHTGPAIVVTLNERLDYFGTTVNVASRMSDLAKRQEVILSQEVLDEPKVADFIAPYRPTSHITAIRGLDAPIPLYTLSTKTRV